MKRFFKREKKINGFCLDHPEVWILMQREDLKFKEKILNMKKVKKE